MMRLFAISTVLFVAAHAIVVVPDATAISDYVATESLPGAEIYALYYGACYYSTKETKQTMCEEGAGCWGSQDKIQWGTGPCPKGTTPINWDATSHRPCGKQCTGGRTVDVAPPSHAIVVVPDATAISDYVATESLPGAEIYALYYGACYYSTKETKETMCEEGAGCWGSQDKIQWGTGPCPKGTTPINWDESSHRPCGKQCTGGRTVDVAPPCHYLNNDYCKETSDASSCSMDWEKSGTCTAAGFPVCCVGHYSIQLWYKAGSSCSGEMKPCAQNVTVGVDAPCHYITQDGDLCNQADTKSACSMDWEKAGSCAAVGFSKCCKGRYDIELFAKADHACSEYNLRDC